MAGPDVPIRARARKRKNQAAPVLARNSLKLSTRRNGEPRRATEGANLPRRIPPLAVVAQGLRGSPWPSFCLRVKSFLCCRRARHCQVPTGCRSSAGTCKFLFSPRPVFLPRSTRSSMYAASPQRTARDIACASSTKRASISSRAGNQPTALLRLTERGRGPCSLNQPRPRCPSAPGGRARGYAATTFATASGDCTTSAS
jgi:hypothetical protein